MTQWSSGAMVLLLRAHDTAALSSAAQVGAFTTAQARGLVDVQCALARRADVCDEVAALAARSAVLAVRAAVCVNPAVVEARVRQALGEAPRSSLLELIVRSGDCPISGPVADTVTERMRTKPTLGLARALIAAGVFLPEAMGCAVRQVGVTIGAGVPETVRQAAAIAARDPQSASWLLTQALAQPTLPAWASVVLESPVVPVDDVVAAVASVVPTLAAGINNGRSVRDTRATLAAVLSALSTHGRDLDPRVRDIVAAHVTGRAADWVRSVLEQFVASATADPVDRLAVRPVRAVSEDEDMVSALARVSGEDEWWAWEDQFGDEDGFVDAVVSAASLPLPTGVKVQAAALLQSQDRSALGAFLAQMHGDDEFGVALYRSDLDFIEDDRFRVFSSVEVGVRALMTHFGSRGQRSAWDMARLFERLGAVLPRGHAAMLDAPWETFEVVLTDDLPLGPVTSAMCARLLGDAQEAMFGSNEQAWLTFVTLSEGFSGSARDLLQASAVV